MANITIEGRMIEGRVKRALEDVSPRDTILRFLEIAVETNERVARLIQVAGKTGKIVIGGFEVNGDQMGLGMRPSQVVDGRPPRVTRNCLLPVLLGPNGDEVPVYGARLLTYDFMLGPVTSTPPDPQQVAHLRASGVLENQEVFTLALDRLEAAAGLLAPAVV